MMDFCQIIGHEDIISFFKRSIESDRIGHAYILSGEEGSGKKMLAGCFAKTLQCREELTDCCNKCQSCQQADSGNHPDIIWLTHEKPNVISVDEVREQVVSSMEIRPYSSKYKIYIIDEAEKMNVQAQNALLKTIEEPPAYGILILLTVSPERLLQTIRSRCILLSTKPVRERDIRDYLISTYGIGEKETELCVEYAAGNLGKAIRLATNEDYRNIVQSVISLEKNIYDMDMEDIAEAIEHCSSWKMEIGEYLDLMMVWYRDILVLKVTGKPDRIVFRDEYSVMKEQAKYLSFNELEDKARAIENAKVRIRANAHLEDVMRLLILTLKEI